MSFDIRFENQDHGVLIYCSGELDAQELNNASRRVFNQLDGSTLDYEIWDFSDASLLKVSVNEMRALVHIEMEAVESGRINAHKVAVVGNLQVVGALARLYSHMSRVWSGNESEYFASLHDARAWVEHRH